uniref:MFS transporter n=1 Tax=Cyberlindnera americana TaxID=36016 RepID=A0A5P8N8J8_9ASCO|nr:MFS transporter [Cyberlindnera americana]
MSSPTSFKEQMDGFPWAQILVISVVRLAEPIAFSSLFTYVYYMVKDLGVAETKAEVSKYAGFLASSFAFCQVLTAVFWGKFADKHGRKPTVIMGLTGSMISILLFGFSTTYPMAIFSRCLMGLVNGNVGVIRTMLGEIAQEKKHQALAFAVMPLLWSLGSVIGPLIGGFLSGKETSIGFMKNFVERFPYSRPNIVIAFILLISILTALFFMEETHYKYQYRHDPFLDIGDRFLSRKFGIPTKTRGWSIQIDEENGDSVPLRDLSTAQSDSEPSSPSQKKADETISTKRVTENDEPEETNLKEILTVPVIAAVVSTFLISAHCVVSDEFVPVFLSSPIVRDSEGHLVSHGLFKIAGGLSYSSQDTGALLSSTGMIIVVFTILALPYINRKMDTLTIYKWFSLPLPFIYFLFPYVVLLADSPMLAKVVVYFLSAARSMCVNLLFPQLNFIVHCCAPPRQRAFVNGISISFGSAARCIAPFIWGFIMSFGLSHEIGWISWWALSLVGVVCLYYSKNLSADEVEDTVRLDH